MLLIYINISLNVSFSCIVMVVSDGGSLKRSSFICACVGRRVAEQVEEEKEHN